MRQLSRLRFFRNYSKKIEKYSSTENKSELEKLFPATLLTKKHKTPHGFYAIHNSTADLVTKIIETELPKCNTIVEINPGLGFFTEKFLARDDLQRIICIESNSHFLPSLDKIASAHSNHVQLRHDDFINMSKLSFQDKIDNGTRISDMLRNVPKREYSDDPNAIVFGAVGSFKFFRTLINSVVFQSGLFQLGRSEMLFIVPPPIFIHLTCDNDVGYMIYRSTSILFQIFFEYKYLGKIPRHLFLPPQIDFNVEKNFKLAKITSIDPDYLYVVKIVPRRNLYDLCPIEDLQALWYFVKQNCISRRNRIVPNLEKWVPGCGPRLIINSTKSEKVQQLFHDQDASRMPKYSTPCKIMSNKDFYPDMNIYTQFGDLSPSQMLTLFTQFRQWKEYSESPFLASLENSFLKMDSTADDNIESDGNSEEEDVVSVDTLEDTIVKNFTSKSSV